MSSLTPPALTAEEFEAIQARFPSAFAGKRAADVPLHNIVTGVRRLDDGDVAVAQKHVESGETLGIHTPNVKALRHTHHRLAQLLAGGMDEKVAARLCNYHFQRVSHLKQDPAFKELLAHYTSYVDESFTDFVDAAANLSMDMLHRLQQVLDEEPEKLSPGTLLEAIKTLADRSGNAPVSRNVNVNANIDMGDRLRRARERANALLSSSG